MSKSNRIAALNKKLASLDLEDRVSLIAREFPKSVFTSSLGMEDQVLTWAIAKSGSSIRIATLDTGRLFEETLSLLRITRERYGIDIEEFAPDQGAIETYANQHGINGFYETVEARKACCEVRKMQPLERALASADAWVTGLRRSQSENRSKVAFVEWDEDRLLEKFNPLADWTTDQIRQAVAAHEIPVNPMHFRGYPSIGCEPCTRAIKTGEPERAGRWWWEQDSSRECGLHIAAPSIAAKPTVVSPIEKLEDAHG